jgi:hypothetical protein
MRDPLGFEALIDARYGEGGIGTGSRSPSVGLTLEAIAITIPQGWPSTTNPGRSTDGPINKRGEVGVGRKSLRLEPAHLARRSRATTRRVAADNPTYRRIAAQALGVVYGLSQSETGR